MANPIGINRAIWCSPHAYGAATRVGAHHLAALLAERGWQVIFLSNPVSLLHHFNRSVESERRRAASRHGTIVESENLRSLVPLTMLPFAGPLAMRSRWMLRNWPDYCFPSLPRHLKELGFDRPDLMVLDGPVAGGLVGRLQPRRSVMRILDRLSGFAGVTEVMAGLESEVAQRVDLVTYSARDLAEHAMGMARSRCLYLSNGVDAAAFADPRPIPDLYRRIVGKKAVYVGAMAEWFDFDLVGQLAAQRPDLHVILIGPAELAQRNLPKLPNLHVLGPLNWTDLPGYLQHADLGLIPFDLDRHGELVQSINPLKLYEYFAAGLPVLSMAWRELKAIDPPAFLADTRQQFLQSVDGALAAPRNGDVLRSFAAGHDWNLALDRLLEAAA